MNSYIAEIEALRKQEKENHPPIRVEAGEKLYFEK